MFQGGDFHLDGEWIDQTWCVPTQNVVSFPKAWNLTRCSVVSLKVAMLREIS